MEYFVDMKTKDILYSVNTNLELVNNKRRYCVLSRWNEPKREETWYCKNGVILQLTYEDLTEKVIKEQRVKCFRSAKEGRRSAYMTELKLPKEQFYELIKDAEEYK